MWHVCFFFINFATMINVMIRDAELRDAAANGMDAFAEAFYDAIMKSIGGDLTQENLALLNSDQITHSIFHVKRGGYGWRVHTDDS